MAELTSGPRTRSESARAAAAGRLEAVHAKWEGDRARRARRRLWVTGLMVLAVAALDPIGYFEGGSNGRYALVVVPFVIVGLLRSRRTPLTLRRLTGPDRPLALLTAYGLVGSVYGAVLLHSSSPALAVFVPMAM